METNHFPLEQPVLGQANFILKQVVNQLASHSLSWVSIMLLQRLAAGAQVKMDYKDWCLPIELCQEATIWHIKCLRKIFHTCSFIIYGLMFCLRLSEPRRFM